MLPEFGRHLADAVLQSRDCGVLACVGRGPDGSRWTGIAADASNDGAVRCLAFVAELVSRMRHPVNGSGCVVDVNGPFILLRQHDERHVEEIVAHAGPQPAETTLALGLQLAEALVEAHALGIYHGHVDSKTVRWGADGARLDWGPALLVMLRSLLVGRETPGAAADVAGVGAVLRHVAGGTPPPPLNRIVTRCAGRSENYGSMVELFADLRADRPRSTTTAAQIAGYQVVSEIGRGGFAVVYRATRLRDGLDVALKVLQPGRDSGTDRRRFTREAKLVASLSAPGTIRVIEHGRCEHGPFIAFEFVDGRALNEVLQRDGALDVRAAGVMFESLLDSLAEAHRLGVLHRDIKPANIMLTADGRTKLLDFGVAKLSEDAVFAGTKLTATGAVLGTPRYLAPENLFGDPLTPASDLYCLGLVMFEALTGKRAISGDSRIDIIKQHLAPESVKLPAGRLPPPLAGAVNRCMQKEPSARPSSATEVLAILRADDVETRPMRRVPRPENRARARVEPRPSARGRNTRLIVAAVAAVVGAAVVGLALGSTDEPDEARRAVSRTGPALGPPLVAPEPIEAHDATDASAGEVDATVMAGCAKAAAPGFATLSRIDGLTERAWNVYVPQGYDGRRPHPVVMVFHGMGRSARDTVEQTGFDELADREGLVLIAPDRAAIVPWRDYRDIGPQLLADTAEQLCLDTDRVFAFGFGSGGRQAENLRCDVSLRAAATASFRGRLDEEARCDGSYVPYLHIAPLSDSYAPVDGSIGCATVAKLPLAEKEKIWRGRHGCDGARRKQVEHDHGTCWAWDCEVPFEVCHVDGGRSWDTMKPPVGVIGEVFERPDCDEMGAEFPYRDVIWSFFEQYLGAR